MATKLLALVALLASSTVSAGADWRAKIGRKVDALVTQLAGAALLGWIAGEIIAGDPLFTRHLDPGMVHSVQIAATTLGAVMVVLIGMVRRRLNRRSAPDQI